MAASGRCACRRSGPAAPEGAAVPTRNGTGITWTSRASRTGVRQDGRGSPTWTRTSTRQEQAPSRPGSATLRVAYEKHWHRAGHRARRRAQIVTAIQSLDAETERSADRRRTGRRHWSRARNRTSPRGRGPLPTGAGTKGGADQRSAKRIAGSGPRCGRLPSNCPGPWAAPAGRAGRCPRTRRNGAPPSGRRGTCAELRRNHATKNAEKAQHGDEEQATEHYALLERLCVDGMVRSTRWWSAPRQSALVAVKRYRWRARPAGMPGSDDVARGWWFGELVMGRRTQFGRCTLVWPGRGLVAPTGPGRGERRRIFTACGDGAVTLYEA